MFFVIMGISAVACGVVSTETESEKSVSYLMFALGSVCFMLAGLEFFIKVVAPQL